MSFERCVKATCSQWDVGWCADTMNKNKEKFKTYYIIATGDIKPTIDDCRAIEEYSGCKYQYGYFYEKYK